MTTSTSSPVSTTQLSGDDSLVANVQTSEPTLEQEAASVSAGLSAEIPRLKVSVKEVNIVPPYHKVSFSVDVDKREWRSLLSKGEIELDSALERDKTSKGLQIMSFAEGLTDVTAATVRASNSRRVYASEAKREEDDERFVSKLASYFKSPECSEIEFTGLPKGFPSLDESASTAVAPSALKVDSTSTSSVMTDNNTSQEHGRSLKPEEEWIGMAWMRYKEGDKVSPEREGSSECSIDFDFKLETMLRGTARWGLKTRKGNKLMTYNDSSLDFVRAGSDKGQEST